MNKSIDTRYGELFREAIRMGFSLADARDWAWTEYQRRKEKAS